MSCSTEVMVKRAREAGGKRHEPNPASLLFVASAAVPSRSSEISVWSMAATDRSCIVPQNEARVLDGHDLVLRAAGEAHRCTTDEVVHRRNKRAAYAMHGPRQRERATPGSRNRPELLPGLRQWLSKRPDGKADRSGGRSVCRFEESNGPGRRSLVALRRFLLSPGLPLVLLVVVLLLLPI